MPKMLRLVVSLAVFGVAFSVGATGVAAQGSGIVHVVRYGEYLELIARRYNTTIEALVEVNDIENAGRIFPGQQLVIPATGGPTTPTAPTTPVVTQPVVVVPASGVHVVRSGENLFRIAQAYGTTVPALAVANGIVNVNRIYIGQRLNIPRLHTVQWGQNLSRIAQAYGSSVAVLMRVNGIVNPNLIYPGQQLVIP
jgi:spore germination protein